MFKRLAQKLYRLTALALILLLGVGPVMAGIQVSGADGIQATGADGIQYFNTSGIQATGADGYLSYTANGIQATGADGISNSAPSGIQATGADGSTYVGPNGIQATGADGIQATGADGIQATGADGVLVTAADGTTYRADSVLIRRANGIQATGADTVNVIGADGIQAAGADGIQATGADGMSLLRANGIQVAGADSVTLITPDGQTFNITPNGIQVSGADQVTVNLPAGILISHATSIVNTGADTLAAAGEDAAHSVGLQSVDPQLALQLNSLTDDSNVNAVVVFHHRVTDDDLATLRSYRVLGGTLYRVLPMIAITATKRQLIKISHMQSVRSIYGNRTLQSTMDARLDINGVNRAATDTDLLSRNAGASLTGRGVTVAVLDTGVDGTHLDLAGRVLRNVKLADTQSIAVGFQYPTGVENLANTDQAYGHGTFVAGVIAGSGARSGGKYSGVAPEANLVALSAGDLTLSFVLNGLDYLLDQGPLLNVRVLNCSFSANALYDRNDPVNIATRMLTNNGVNVVFSAGNTGSGLHTLNPYAVAPWVISVGATDNRGRLADFSSRGDFGSALFRPTLVAPGINVVGLRASGANLTGTEGLAATDTSMLTPAQLPYYTTASGTSFSAPQVAGTIALMLQVNPGLTPAQVRNILRRTATPMPSYYQHEVGAGMLNAYAAVLAAAFPQRQIGAWRSTLDRGQVRFVTDPAQVFSGIVTPGYSYQSPALTIPENTLVASFQVSWGPPTTSNDLSLSVFDPRGVKQDGGNTLNQPGLTGKRERVTVRQAAPGTWSAQVSNTGTLGLLASSQPIDGALEVTRIEYAPLSDVGGLSAASRAEIYQAVRTFTMFPYGGHYRPDFAVSRAELASAIVMSGCVPQYAPSQSRYTDVRDATTMNFIESAQAAPGGALFPEAVTGGEFRPDATIDRATAAIALVRAAGLQDEVSLESGVLEFTDASAIPVDKRPYVAVAIRHNLLDVNAGMFRPQSNLTRAELAHALSTLINR